MQGEIGTGRERQDLKKKTKLWLQNCGQRDKEKEREKESKRERKRESEIERKGRERKRDT